MARILIDMQACQNGSRYRGIGRYVDALVTAMLQIDEGDEFHLLFNAALPETIPALTRRFGKLVAASNIHILNVVIPNSTSVPLNLWRNDASALLLETYIDSIAPDVVFNPSFFEGFSDDVVMSIGRLSSVPVVVTLHDLVPLIYKEKYLWGNVGYSKSYHAKLDEVKRSAGLITISESTSSEAIDLLGFAADNLVNASEAADDIFCPIDYNPGKKELLLKQFGIEKPFVFYTGGSDPRKNLPKLLSAFADLPKMILGAHQLVFAGGIPQADRQFLRELAKRLGIAPNVIFLGYVSDTDLINLYNLAELFVFPSLHEGFGLPPLEAMQCGTATIGSNVSSIPEVIGSGDAMFDPNSQTEITAKMERVLSDPVFRDELVRLGKEQAAGFSWASSAKKALAGIKKFASSRENRVQRSAQSWTEIRADLDKCDQRLIVALEALPKYQNGPSDNDLMQLAQAMVHNRQAAEARLRPGRVVMEENAISWRLEGPFDSSYSLAMVNRQLALGLAGNGHDVSLLSSEGPGDFAPDEGFLAAHSELAIMYKRALAQAASQATVISRNMYPPRVSDMDGQINGLHNYAWEETAFPADFVAAFNESLQFITVTAEHVKKTLIDNGVSVPVAVVGNGVDHWNQIAASTYTVETAKHTFLHVSSCFPRKGADVLLKSYGMAFTARDDVLLIIKTFANPHNKIAAELEAMQAEHDDYPAVLIIMDDLSDADLKALYQQCQTLVAPSRAEGFGLPIAEAMLSDIEVITTGWSGQLDFCSSDNVDLIDFAYARAQTHEGTYDSVWAEPDVDHLAQLMGEAVGKKRRPVRTRKAALTTLLKQFSWSEVAKRNVAAVQNIVAAPFHAEPRVGWVSTYRKHCGIATYSEHLLDVLDMPVTVLAETGGTAPTKTEDHVVQCWQEGSNDTLAALLAEIVSRNLDLVVIQFNYGFFNFERFNQFLIDVADRGVQIVVTLHSTVDPTHVEDKKLAHLVPGLSRCARLLVHSVHDLNRLKGLDLDQHATLFPHGVRVPRVPALSPIKRGNKPLMIASYGFFLPNKGLIELIHAVDVLRKNGQNVRLRMINAEFPADVSAKLIDAARILVKELGLSNHVELNTAFLPDKESMALLAEADIVVYPYQQTGESASGAVRYGLASGVPVAVTPLAIFDDVADIAYKLPGILPTEIAQGLGEMMQKMKDQDVAISEQGVRAKAWRTAHSYPVLGERLRGMLRGIHRNRNG